MVKYIADFYSAWGVAQKKYPERMERITRFSMNNGYSMRIYCDNRMIIQVKEPSERELYEKSTARLNYWLKFH